MASISTDKNNGRRTIQFVDSDGTRRSIRLGKVTKTQAEQTKRYIEALLSAKLAGSAPDRQTSVWLSEAGDVLHGRLARVGLCEPGLTDEVAEPDNESKAQAVTVKDWVEQCIAKRTDVKPGTKLVWVRARKRLCEYFGTDKLLAEVTSGDALDFRRWLLEKYPSENTVRRMTGNCRQFWNEAIAHELVSVNPFVQRGIPCAATPNRERFYFVPRADIDRVLSACPDADWRAIVALCRYGGLRCPSEVLLLKWSDIEWDTGRMLVTSPKTAHHAGGENRLVPLFPELRVILTECFEAAAAGNDLVVTRYQYAKNTNLRTMFQKIIKRAGLKPWPKLFQNLRSTRETELAESYPMHVVCQWIGNSELVAAKHYLQTTDEHFSRAAGTNAITALQNPVQCRNESRGSAPDSAALAHEKPRETTLSRGKRSNSMGVTGFEPVTSSV